MELFDVDLAIVRRQAHTDKQHRRAVLPTLFDNGAEIAAHIIEWQGTQTVVAAQLDEKNMRRVLGERLGHSCKTTACRVATNAGIDDTVRIALLMQSLLKQVHPAVIGFDAIAGTEAVTQHNDGGSFGDGLCRKQPEC